MTPNQYVSPAANTFAWNTIFASKDHSLAESDLVRHILNSGGEFVDDTTGRPKIVKVWIWRPSRKVVSA